MNGTNSNTNGADVANIGFWPTRFYSIILQAIGDATKLITDARNESADVLGVDFSEKGPSDKISDDKMQEIARRLIVTREREGTGNVVFSPEAPEDHTKVWWQTDPVTGIPIGQPQVWDAEQERWVDSTSTPGATPARERFGTLYFPPGTSTQNISFVDMLTVNYDVIITPTTIFEGVFLPFPGSFPRDFGWVVVNRTNTMVSIAADGVPNIGSEEAPRGLTFEVTIRERKPSA